MTPRRPSPDTDPVGAGFKPAPPHGRPAHDTAAPSAPCGRPPLTAQPDPPPEPQPYRVDLPLPPTDNHCHTNARNPVTGQPIRRATDDYLTWIRQASILVRHARRGPMDTAHWWHVEIYLFLPARRGDAQNYIKPLLDILSGAVVINGRIQHTDTGLWDDDRRVASLNLRLHAVGCQPNEAHAIIQATTVAAPPVITRPATTKPPAIRGRR